MASAVGRVRPPPSVWWTWPCGDPPTGAKVSLTNGTATGTITNDDTGPVCTIEGTVGDDPVLTGTAADDVLCGLAGDDDL